MRLYFDTIVHTYIINQRLCDGNKAADIKHEFTNSLDWERFNKLKSRMQENHFKLHYKPILKK